MGGAIINEQLSMSNEQLVTAARRNCHPELAKDLLTAGTLRANSLRRKREKVLRKLRMTNAIAHCSLIIAH
jgi:hypothetical protein